MITQPTEDYFAVRQYSADYDFDGEPAVLTIWYRPLHAMINAFTSAGYRIATVSEPGPSPDTPRERLPPRILTGEKTAFLSFIFFVLEAV